MGFNADFNEYDYEITCPNCGSGNVVVEEKEGYYYIGNCKKCGYKKQESKFNNANSS